MYFHSYTSTDKLQCFLSHTIKTNERKSIIIFYISLSYNFFATQNWKLEIKKKPHNSIMHTPIQKIFSTKNFIKSCTCRYFLFIHNVISLYAAGEESGTESSASVVVAAPHQMGWCQASVLLYHLRILVCCNFIHQGVKPMVTIVIFVK
jgi:hypothetical protein